MEPSDAVAELAAILLASPDASEEEIYNALTRRGLTKGIADRTYKLTQIAWGRVFLDDLGITFLDQYYCLNAQGCVVEDGRLTDEPYFQAASRLAGESIHTSAFLRLALASADVHNINELLKAGSKPENLLVSASFVFLAMPTPEGLRAAQVVMDAHHEEIRRTHKRKPKPWWRFWG
jgi:hypothetical protein